MRLFGKRLRRDARGNVSMLMGGGLVMLAATSALGIDTATLFLEKRRLQGVADATAIAAAAGSAWQAPSRAGDRVVTIERGHYDPDPARRAADRFVVGAADPNAARVTMTGAVDTIFGRVLGVASPIAIGATATAARIDTAALSIGSRLAAVDGGIANRILSDLAGSELHLTALDYTALASAQVDLLAFTDALRTRAGLTVASFGEVLGASVDLPTAVETMADVAGDPAAAAALRTLAKRIPARKGRIGDLIELGPLAAASALDPHRAIRVGALSLLRETILVGGAARTVSATLSPAVPGLATTRVRLEIGARPATSPWLAVGRGGEVTVRTVQARLLVDATLASPVLGLAQVHVPIVAELAPAEATLTRVDCARVPGRGVGVSVTTGTGQVALAEVDEGAFATFGTALTMRTARIVSAPLLSVTARSAIPLSDTAPQSLRFDDAEIAAGTIKSVASRGIVGGVAAALVRDADVRVTLLGLGLNASVVAAAVGTTLSAAAPALDTLLDGVTGAAGVRIGEADVWVNGLRCGVPVLVG